MGVLVSDSLVDLRERFKIQMKEANSLVDKVVAEQCKRNNQLDLMSLIELLTPMAKDIPIVFEDGKYVGWMDRHLVYFNHLTFNPVTRIRRSGQIITECKSLLGKVAPSNKKSGIRVEAATPLWKGSSLSKGETRRIVGLEERNSTAVILTAEISNEEDHEEYKRLLDEFQKEKQDA